MALHAVIRLQLSVPVYPWCCAAVEWHSRNPSDTCDLILCWNDIGRRRIMYSFLVCSSRSVSVEAFYPLHAWDCPERWGYEMMMSQKQRPWYKVPREGPWGRLTSGIQLHVTLATTSWALFPQVLPEWNASACSGEYSLQTFLFTRLGQQKMDEGTGQ